MNSYSSIMHRLNKNDNCLIVYAHKHSAHVNKYVYITTFQILNFYTEHLIAMKCSIIKMLTLCKGFHSHTLCLGGMAFLLSLSKLVTRYRKNKNQYILAPSKFQLCFFTLMNV